MNAHVHPVVEDQYAHWAAALAAGKGVETEKGNPRSGYYRNRDEAVAFWRDETGALCVWRSGAFPAPTKLDAIDELFGFCAPHPVTGEAFEEFQTTGRWPDQIAPVDVDETLEPHQRADAMLTAHRAALLKYLESIGGKVTTQEQATKVGNWADEFAKIEGASTKAHKAEKEPHLEAGRAVDAKWKPVIGRADEFKRWAKKMPETFLIAEKARLKAEQEKAERAAAEARRKIEEANAKAAAEGAPAPAIAPELFAASLPPAPAKAKAGKVHLRSRTVYEIEDFRAAVEFFTNFNDRPPELVDVVQKLVNKVSAAGVKVPGVKTNKIEEAA